MNKLYGCAGIEYFYEYLHEVENSCYSNCPPVITFAHGTDGSDNYNVTDPAAVHKMIFKCPAVSNYAPLTHIIR